MPTPIHPTDPSPAREAALRVVRTLRDAGHEALFAGGCVRDALLGLEPTDFDVATDAPPERVQELFRRTQAVGAAFGVVLVHQKVGGARRSTEVATFRTDGAYADGRRPDGVTFATAEEDAQRRDFTCNGLFSDPLHATPESAGHPLADADGVIDFVGGRADLAAGVLRAIGVPAERFAEDHLRLLRLVRFAARFGFRLDPATAEAAQAAAPRVAGVAAERVGEELRRVLTAAAPAPALGVRLLQDLSLAEPALGPGEGRPPATLAALGDAPHATALATLALDRHGAPADASAVVRGRWAASLCLPNAVADDAVAALLGLDRLRGWDALGVPQRKRLASSPGFHAGAFALLRATDPDAARRVGADLDALAADGVGLAPRPLLDGRALIAAGLRPGPAFKGLLDAAYDAQLAGEVTDAAGALGFAQARAAPPPR